MNCVRTTSKLRVGRELNQSSRRPTRPSYLESWFGRLVIRTVEILIYKRADLWEACFFLWAFHHEHAIGSSFDCVKNRAEDRIRILQEKKFKSAGWRE